MLSIYMSMVDAEDEQALVEFLYKEYRRLMYNTAMQYLHNKDDAEDAVHEAFLRVIKNLSKFRKYSCYENVSYLVIIVRGIALNMISSRDRFSELDEDMPGTEAIEESVEYRITYGQVMENIKKLSPRLKDIATLHWVNHLSEKEISDLLCIDINAVRMSVSRARTILKSKVVL